MPTRAEALTAAGRILAQARARRDALSPEDAARAAYTPGGPSTDELAALIREQRAVAAAEFSVVSVA
ncbi:hypothetical protein [Nonomuraea aridisoli]|uniref:hypothetical protein n=1 Tax=Nonomuraea aridisoli TaxID=2070368 RepID=UPI0011B9436F|nr:hypothetical protein [Nonomuraea aridisoli]